MAQSPPKVLLHFDLVISGADGTRYLARACGRENELGTWEGWLEFEPVAEGEILATPRETTQPDERAALYWATGLSEIYLHGALQRAIDAASQPTLYAVSEDSRPTYDRPAPDLTARTGLATPLRPRPVLDPFAVYLQGDQVLRDELRALDESHLRNIIRAYHLASDTSDLSGLAKDDLAKVIVEAVRTARPGGP
jgi:hypothetical protein